MAVNNLYVNFDEDGTAHHFINDDEVDQAVWMQQHPHMRKGKDSGRDGNSDSGRSGPGGELFGSDAEQAEKRSQGLREQRAKAEAERAGSAGDAVG